MFTSHFNSFYVEKGFLGRGSFGELTRTSNKGRIARERPALCLQTHLSRICDWKREIAGFAGGEPIARFVSPEHHQIFRIFHWRFKSYYNHGVLSRWINQEETWRPTLRRRDRTTNWSPKRRFANGQSKSSTLWPTSTSLKFFTETSNPPICCLPRMAQSKFVTLVLQRCSSTHMTTRRQSSELFTTWVPNFWLTSHTPSKAMSGA